MNIAALLGLTNSVVPASAATVTSTKKSMDGLVMPQPSAMAHDSDFNNRCPVPGDSNTTLWQFLLELLRDGGYPHLIQWTNREGEFKLLNAEGVAQLWGKRKGKEHMNYDKLSRALRYYYDKNIIKKVIGQKFVYRFVGNQDTASSHTSADNLYHPYRLNTGMKLLTSQGLGIDMQNIKKEDHAMTFLPAIPTSSALPMTPVQQMNTSDLASLNLSGVSSTNNDTPSPTDSSCSPNSMCSSSGVSSAVPTIATPPGPSSRPGSAHSDDNSLSRKRKASPPPPIKVEKDVSQPAARRSRPENLDLASTQFLNPTLPMAISPMNVMQQMSPFLLPQQMQLYALASASLCGPNSPLFSGISTNSPFRSPLSTPKMSQVFQFPPVSTAASAVSALANFMNSPAMLSTGLNGNSNSIFKFPTNDVLKTPTLPILSQLATKPVPVNSDS